MSFQKTVRKHAAFGVVGERQFHGPNRAGSYILKSTDASNNVVGRAFTFVDGEPGFVQAGGTGEFAGILANPKVYAYRGTLLDSGESTQRLQLPNGIAAEFVTMDILTVIVDKAAKVGDQIAYSNTTGELTVVAKGEAAASGYTLVPNATITPYAQTDASGGLVVARLTN